MGFIIIYVTHANERVAKKISNYLIEKKLVACANIFPITSAYWWKGYVDHENEWVSIIKTTNELWDTVKQAIENVHPYEVPCIMKMEVEANDAYEKWIRESVKKIS